MSEFTRSDYLRIKWPFVALTASLMVGIGLFSGLRVLNEKAAAQLRVTRTANEEAQQKVDKISQEEASIRANIGQYQIIKAAGLVSEVDLLQMQERFGILRSQNNLFPIPVKISAQTPLPIEYGELDGNRVDNPGRQIVLEVSSINFKLPLLHENDLANLLNGLLMQHELLQVQSCTIEDKTRSEQTLLRLGQHFSAECTLAWYSFRINEVADKLVRKR